MQNPQRSHSYASVAARGTARSKKQPRRNLPRSQQSGSTTTRSRITTGKPTVAEASVSAASSSVAPGSTAQGSSSEQRPRVKVEGARKVWATHPHATVKTVENVISRFCNIQGLRIRRKTRRNEISRKSIWWFVIHTDEAVLSELDVKWDSVNVQTFWILNQCTKPADNADTADTDADTAVTDSEVDNIQEPTGSNAQQQVQGNESGDIPISEDINTPEDPSFLAHTQNPTSAT